METLDLRLVRAPTFEPLINTEFSCADPEAQFVLEVVERASGHPGLPREEPFVLLFAGPAGLEQQTYELRHETLGRLEVFLVPIGPGADGRHRYEAVFN